MDYDHVYQSSASCRLSVANFLLDRSDKIKSRWEALVSEKSSKINDPRFPAIANSLGTFLSELALILRRPESDPEVLSENAMSKIYGGQKAAVEGYPLSRLLWEFSLVREAVIKELQSELNLTPDVHSVIDRAIDASMSSAVTEFEKIQKSKLQATLAKVEASNKALDEFALIAAHDLNSPVATATGILELLNDSLASHSNPEASEYVEIIDRALTRMRGLITSLLEYARFGRSSGFKNVDLNESLSASLQNLAQLIKTTNSKIESRPLPKEVRGDFNLLSLVFQNLITNSIKYRGSTNPKIEISVIEDPQVWIISVKDNGMGFEAKDKEEIFSLYKRLKTQGEHPGAGIGLATCRKIIELHGGKIWAESSPNAGSTFYFSLPKSSASTSN